MGRARNPNLKKANQQVEMTPEQVLEFKKCANDPIYFIRTYVMIQHPIRGAVPFELYPYQERLIKAYQENRFSVVLSARQTGKSVTSASYLLWFAIFHFDKTILIASNKNKNAMEMILRIRFAYENLPMWLKPGVTDDGWNKHNVSFDNGSRIESAATSEDSGRGMSISLLFLDEFAFVNPSIQEDFWTSIEPTLSTGGSCIMSSTPNGDSNKFAQIWRGAQLGANGFYAIQIFWDEPPGRDDVFKAETIGKLGERKWLQEYECVFLSSDAQLIDSLFLANLTSTLKDIKPLYSIRDIVFWKEPLPGTTLLISVDPSTGNGHDFSAIEVFDFPTMDQVAEFRSNSMSSPFLYNILKGLLRYLEQRRCTVYFTVENNGVGEGIIALYQNDEMPPEAEFVSEQGKDRMGLTTTGKTKIRTCLSFKEMLEKGTIQIKSRILLQELKEFVRKNNTYTARRGSTDDNISACLMIIRIIEEISTYDQEAFNKLYNADPEGGDWEKEEYNENDENDGPMGILF